MMPRILIVDDDPATLKLVQSILSSNGYETITAEDGLDALVKIKRERPDLIVLDIMMPEINGYDVCFQLRFNDDFRKLPIILLTQRPRELDEEIGSKVNIEYIPKPVVSKLLLEKITKLLN